MHAVSSPGPILTQFATDESVTIHAVAMPRRITPVSDVAALFRLWRLFKTLGPQVVHAHTPKGGLLGMLAAKLAGVSVRIYHMHGLPFLTATGITRRILLATETVSCAIASQVLCVSQSVRSTAVELGLASPEKIKVLLKGSCNGIDAAAVFNPDKVPGSMGAEIRSRYGIPCEAVVVGFVGRLAKAKGLVELGSAWNIMRDRDHRLRLVLIGPDEPGDPPPAGVIEQLRRDPRVHFIGENWNTPPLYRAMDILVLPTHREGLPIVLLEAAAMGLPIVATRVTGCVDAVQDGVTGTLVPAYDSAALAEAIQRYAAQPSLRESHGKAGRAWMLTDFSGGAMRAAIYEEYARLLAKGGVFPASTDPKPTN